MVRDNDGDEREAAAYLQLPVDLVTAAVAYYDAHEAEIELLDALLRRCLRCYLPQQVEQFVDAPDVFGLTDRESIAE